MAIRENTILLKRSDVPGKIPLAGDIQLGELALNIADVKLYASGTTENDIVQIGWDRISRTGDTVTGDYVINGGLTANTMSATTYQNLPISGVTGGTGISATTSNGVVTITNTSPNQTVTISGGTNIQIAGIYPNFGVNFTGTTGGGGGDYLPLSGGTVTGATNFTNGLIANTISGGTYVGDGSQLNVANPSTGTTITFTAGTIYNSPTSVATGNISGNTTNAKIGIVQKIYHNDSVAPTFNPSGWVKLGIGTYTTSTLNVIYAEWISGTRIEYWITQ